MPSQFSGTSCHDVLSKRHLRNHMPPLTTRCMYPFWNRDSFMGSAVQTTQTFDTNTQGPAPVVGDFHDQFRMLGQHYPTSGSWRCLYLCPDGHEAYVTITFEFQVRFTAPNYLDPIDMYFTNPDAFMYRGAQHVLAQDRQMLYGFRLGVANAPFTMGPFCLTAGQAFWFHSGQATIATVTGVESSI